MAKNIEDIAEGGNFLIEKYEVLTGNDPSLRCAELRKREWQRWFPGLTFYRSIADEFNHDSLLLNAIHSDGYQALNGIYNFGTTVGLVGLTLSQMF